LSFLLFEFNFYFIVHDLRNGRGCLQFARNRSTLHFNFIKWSKFLPRTSFKVDDITTQTRWKNVRIWSVSVHFFCLRFEHRQHRHHFKVNKLIDIWVLLGWFVYNENKKSFSLSLFLFIRLDYFVYATRIKEKQTLTRLIPHTHALTITHVSARIEKKIK